MADRAVSTIASDHVLERSPFRFAALMLELDFNLICVLPERRKGHAAFNLQTKLVEMLRQ